MVETVRVWLVEREYDDKGLVRLTYSTPEGDRRRLSERSTNMLRDGGVTAAMDVDPERLDDVPDAETRERYREEVERVMARYEPDESI